MAVVTKTVVVTHLPAKINAEALACALDSANLDASLIAPRQQVKLKRSFFPPPQGLPILLQLRGCMRNTYLEKSVRFFMSESVEVLLFDDLAGVIMRHLWHWQPNSFERICISVLGR